MLFKGVIEMSTGRIKRAVKIYNNTFKKEHNQRVVDNYKYFNSPYIVNIKYKRVSNIYRMIYNRFEHSVDHMNVDGTVFEEIKLRLKRRQVMN